MTERTVRSMAKELAGVYYDQERTPGFRKAFPTLKAYMRGQWHQPDGSIRAYRPGWQHHVELARKMMATMLGMSDSVVHLNVKNAIFEGLIEDRNRQFKAEQTKWLKDLPQAKMQPDA